MQVPSSFAGPASKDGVPLPERAPDETLALRAIRPEDEGPLRAAFEVLSQRSRYARFRGLAAPTDALWHMLTHVDGVDHVALVLVNDAGQIRGVGRFIRFGTGTRAEIALTVADAWQRRGLGQRLLAELLPLARARGIDWLIAYAAADNVGIARLLIGNGATSLGVQSGEIVLTLSTAPRSRVDASGAAGDRQDAPDDDDGSTSSARAFGVPCTGPRPVDRASSRALVRRV
jgi:GNAT superfamily N-acetyltransferase